MKLQRNTLLALYSVLEFAAEPARRRSAAAIALKYGASVHHVAKVLGRLGGAGLLRASRGAGGGYRFVGNAFGCSLRSSFVTAPKKIDASSNAPIAPTLA